MKDLFHGTTYDINKIDVTQGKGYKDFGKGFYATAIKSHAENIARRNKRIFEARDAKIRQRNPGYKTKAYKAYRYSLEFVPYLYLICTSPVHLHYKQIRMTRYIDNVEQP